MSSSDVIKAEDIFIQELIPSKEEVNSQSQTLEQIEAKAILSTLKMCADNKTRAAKILNITVKTLKAKLEKIL
jgi:transcriptional regulator with PAS, ATPase and Fis domain